MVQMDERVGRGKTIVRETKMDYCRFFFDKLAFSVFFLGIGALVSLFISVGILESFAFFSRLEKDFRVLVARSLLAVVAMIVLFFIFLLYRKVFQKEVSLNELSDERFDLMIGGERCNHRKSELKMVRMIYKRNKYEEVKRRILLVKIQNRRFRFSSKSDELETLYKHLERWKNNAEKLAEHQAETGWSTIENGPVRIVENLKYSATPFARFFAGALFGIIGIFLYLVLLLVGFIALYLLTKGSSMIATGGSLIVATTFFVLYVTPTINKLLNKLFRKKIILTESGAETFDLTAGTEHYKYRKDAIKFSGISYRYWKNRLVSRTLVLQMNDRTLRFSSDAEQDEMDIMQSYLEMWGQGVGSVIEENVQEKCQPIAEESVIDINKDIAVIDQEKQKEAADDLDGEIVEHLSYSKIPLLRSIVGIFLSLIGLVVFGFFAILGIRFLELFLSNTNGFIGFLFKSVGFILFILLVAAPLAKAYDKLFSKRVILIDADEETFELRIADECGVYQKADIQKVRMIYKKSRGRRGRTWSRSRVASRVLIVKIKGRVFRFASDGERDKMDDMYKRLEVWQRQAEKIAQYKTEAGLS